jgi:hypothetical protein
LREGEREREERERERREREERERGERESARAREESTHSSARVLRR